MPKEVPPTSMEGHRHTLSELGQFEYALRSFQSQLKNAEEHAAGEMGMHVHVIIVSTNYPIKMHARLRPAPASVMCSE